MLIICDFNLNDIHGRSYLKVKLFFKTARKKAVMHEIFDHHILPHGFSLLNCVRNYWEKINNSKEVLLPEDECILEKQ